jgi:uncharacterized integral membrane protein (TIGR00697 family)
MSKEKLLNIIIIFNIVMIIIANVMATKVVSILGVIMDAGTLTYPLSFMIGDLATEFYGFKTAKKVIYWGFGANLTFCIFAFLGTMMPALDPLDPLSMSYDLVFTFNLRILAASFIAYLAGSLLNAAGMVWIKNLSGERFFALRTIGSTAIGALLDTVLFTFLAWFGVMGLSEILNMILTSYVIKMVYEGAFATPLAMAIRPIVKRHVFG